VQASRAHWVGVRVHVILLGIVVYVFYGNCTEDIIIQNKRRNEHEYLIIMWLQWIAKRNESSKVDKKEEHCP
jgi:hypothetical protein